MKKIERLEILDQLRPGLNFIFGPPLIGKTTLCKKLERACHKVVHASFDIISQDSGELGDEHINSQTLKSIKRVINLMKKNRTDITYVIDIHPYFFKLILPFIKNINSFTMLLLTCDFHNKGEVALWYSLNAQGDLYDAVLSYHDQFHDCFRSALSLLKPKVNKTISLHKNFVMIKF